jgi:hypothetical protein
VADHVAASLKRLAPELRFLELTFDPAADVAWRFELGQPVVEHEFGRAASGCKELRTDAVRQRKGEQVAIALAAIVRLATSV